MIILENEKFFTWSNIVSASRFVLTLPIAWTIYYDMPYTAFLLCWFAAFTDWLDGYLARRTNTVSEWGKIIDPVADKVLVGTVVALLLVKGLLPLWFVLTVVARDIFILIGSLYASRYTTVVLPSMMSGKLAVSAIAFTGVMALIHVHFAVKIGIWVSLCFMTVSLWQYSS
jgi:cardiolipin synthase (CMP-forming)